MIENQHRLLGRQLKKNISPELMNNPEFQDFLSSVNDAYHSYDTEYKQLERMFEMSSKESFKELNNIRFALDQAAAVFIIDTKRTIKYVNENFCTITSYKREEVIEQDYIKFFFTPYHEKEFFQNAIETLLQGKVWKNEIKANDKHGDPYWTDTTIVPLTNNEGKPIQFLFISIDITVRKNAEEQLRNLSLVADKTDNGVVITDEKGRIEWVNSGFTRMTEYKLEEIRGKKPGLFLQGKDTNPETNKYISEQLRKAVSFDTEILNYTKSGTPYWVHTQISPILNYKGQIEKFIGIQLNITHRKEIETQRINAIQNLKAVNQELNDFAYIVSHDLKAPLRSIGSLASWLKTDYADKLDEEGQNILTLLDQRTHRMHNLIEGVLNYSKIGRVKNNIILQNTQQIVEGVVDALAPGEKFKFEIQKNLPSVLYEDIKYGQVFQNLISNAIKYMDKPNGIITIGVNDLENEWEFYVGDNGPGIEEQHFKKIFQIFQTLKARDEYESTGIGLTIVKKIIESNGGIIRVESKVGEGSKFYFTVPKKN